MDFTLEGGFLQAFMYIADVIYQSAQAVWDLMFTTLGEILGQTPPYDPVWQGLLDFPLIYVVCAGLGIYIAISMVKWILDVIN